MILLLASAWFVCGAALWLVTVLRWASSSERNPWLRALKRFADGDGGRVAANVRVSLVSLAIVALWPLHALIAWVAAPSAPLWFTP